MIAYDRLIEDANTFYVSFDNVLVGQLMAEVVFDLVPTGNYFIVKGNGSDANSDFLREGIGVGHRRRGRGRRHHDPR